MSHARVVDHVKRLWILLVLMGVPMMQAFAQPSSGPERRVAFVIGIGAYKNAPRLPNPVNDARAIGDVLRHLNFEVEEVYDPDFRELTRSLRAFGIKAQQADVAVIYWECPANGGMTTQGVRSVGSIADRGNGDAMGVAVDCDGG
jgi:Caspase domain